MPGVLQARNGQPPVLYGGGTFNVFNLKTKTTRYNVGGRAQQRFLDKRLLLDVRIGWHHQLDEGVPGDGSEFNTGTGGTLAGIPGHIQHRRPEEHRPVDEPDCPAVRQPARSVRHPECGFLGYFVGGPGFIERLKLDSYQGRGC